MSKHWYRNDELNNNKLISDGELIPEGYSRDAYSKFQSKLQSGENNPNYGKHKSLETKTKISKANLGKKHSEETKRHLSEVHLGKKRPNYHPNHKGKNNPRYGVRWTMPEETKKHFLETRHKTMKKNNSFVKSKAEEEYYLQLLEKYTPEDIIRQYKSNVYPFASDFYIVSEDKYIECNFNWTHGPHMFDENNSEDIQLLEKWKSKTNGHDYYSQAIYTWTDLDVRKRKIAEENHLNIEFIYNKH